jgi:uncharacterized protein (DUF885 family)
MMASITSQKIHAMSRILQTPRFLLAAICLGLSFTAQAAPPTDSARLAKIADDYFETRLALFPLSATEDVGDSRFDAKLEIDIAPAHRAKQAAAYQDLLKKLAGIKVDGLAESDRLTWQLLKYDADIRLALLKHPRHLMPFNHQDAVPTRLAQWGGGDSVQPFKTVQQYRNYLQRLERIPAWTAQATANIREGMKTGVVLPRAIVERALPQFKTLTEGAAEASLYYRPIKKFPASFSAADKASLARDYATLLNQRVIPALKQFHSFLETEYLPKTRATAGWGALPNGRAWYETQVREATTLMSLTPEAIHDLGLKEVARIRGEMEGVRQQVKYAGDLNSFLKGLVDKPELTPFKTEEEILARFRAIDTKMRPALDRLFSRKPKAPLEIRGVDPLLKDSASSSYILPAEDGSRPGVFYAVVNDPLKFTTTSMAALLLHEGQPGHHFHMALQQELDIPRFRRFFWYDAFGEGWALYAESLGKELGVYDDPYDYLGRLQMELHRAIRLVVDTGLHAKGWTREQTIQYIMETEGSLEPNARRATERYMTWPGQALSYKIGELKIIELRERAKQALGAKFDIKLFHAEVLSAGAMPLSMLETRIDAWIKRGGA